MSLLKNESVAKGTRPWRIALSCDSSKHFCWEHMADKFLLSLSLSPNEVVEISDHLQFNLN